MLEICYDDKRFMIKSEDIFFGNVRTYNADSIHGSWEISVHNKEFGEFLNAYLETKREGNVKAASISYAAGVIVYNMNECRIDGFDSMPSIECLDTGQNVFSFSSMSEHCACFINGKRVM
jgi:hypothetical protein